MNPRRASIDWPRLLDDIAYLIGEPIHEGSSVRTPVGSRALADYLGPWVRPDEGLNRGTLRGWLEGAEPRHSDGECLIAVWCRLCGKSEESAPITVRSLSAFRA